MSFKRPVDGLGRLDEVTKSRLAAPGVDELRALVGLALLSS